MIPDDILTFLWKLFLNNPDVLSKIQRDNPRIGNLRTKIQIKNKLLRRNICWDVTELIKVYLPGGNNWDKMTQWHRMWSKNDFSPMKRLMPEFPVEVQQDGEVFMI